MIYGNLINDSRFLAFFMHCYDMVCNFCNQLTHINQFYFVVFIYLWLFTMSQLVTKSSDEGIVVGMTEGSKNIGYYESGKLSIIFFCPLFKQLSAFFFRVAISI